MMRDAGRRKDKVTSSVSSIKDESTEFSGSHSSPSKTFECQFENCEKKLNSTYRLKIHLRIHTGVKPFKCISCDKCFAEKGNLKTHLRIHTGERPYICKFVGCMSSYKVYSHLKDHVNSLHLKNKPFACEFCQKAFSRKNALKTHSKRHANYQETIQCENNSNCLPTKRYRSLNNKICSTTTENGMSSEHSLNFSYSNEININNYISNTNQWIIPEDLDFMKESSSFDLFQVYLKKKKQRMDEIYSTNENCNESAFQTKERILNLSYINHFDGNLLDCYIDQNEENSNVMPDNNYEDSGYFNWSFRDIDDVSILFL